MAIKNSSSRLRVRKTKRILQRKNERFKQALITKLTMLDDELHSSSQNHSFLHNSVMTLAADELDTEFWLSGAMSHYRWLQRSDKRIADQLQQLRLWVKQ